MTDNGHKNVRYDRGKRTKFENDYIRGIIHNLSLQRWTDQEIVYYLDKEKDIEIDRSRVSRIRNSIEKEAEKWYIELQRSRYKYIAVYKERLDSLFSYQKKLNQIVDRYLPPPPNTLTNTLTYPDTIIKAISELHRIELSILNIFKALPHFEIANDKELEQLESELNPN